MSEKNEGNAYKSHGLGLWVDAKYRGIGMNEEFIRHINF